MDLFSRRFNPETTLQAWTTGKAPVTPVEVTDEDTVDEGVAPTNGPFFDDEEVVVVFLVVLEAVDFFEEEELGFVVLPTVTLAVDEADELGAGEGATTPFGNSFPREFPPEPPNLSVSLVLLVEGGGTDFTGGALAGSAVGGLAISEGFLGMLNLSFNLA